MRNSLRLIETPFFSCVGAPPPTRLAVGPHVVRLLAYSLRWGPTPNALGCGASRRSAPRMFVALGPHFARLLASHPNKLLQRDDLRSALIQGPRTLEPSNLRTLGPRCLSLNVAAPAGLWPSSASSRVIPVVATRRLCRWQVLDANGTSSMDGLPYRARRASFRAIFSLELPLDWAPRNTMGGLRRRQIASSWHQSC